MASGQNQAERYISKLAKVVVPAGCQTTVVFDEVHRSAAPGGGARSVVYDYR